MTRATGAEGALGASLTSEISRATGAEATLTTNLAGRSISRHGGRSAESQAGRREHLFTAGSQKLAASTATYSSMNVPAGAAPATPVAGDLFLLTGPDSHLQFVDTTSTTQELAFLSDVTASNTSVAAETARATAAEGAEVTRATAAEGVLTGNLAAEVTRATGAEGALGASLTSEISRATGAEATLTTNLAGEVTRATAEEALKANLANGNTFTAGSQKLAASTATYSSMNVPAGVAPATPVAGDLYIITGGDNHLQFMDPSATPQELAFMSDVTTSNASVTAETARATAAEGAEVTRATAAEGVLTGNLAAEVTRATGAEGALGASLTSEISRATGAEATLTTNLAGEVSRATAEEALKANLANGNVFTAGSQTLAAQHSDSIHR